jgi:hypothetical protein
MPQFNPTDVGWRLGRSHIPRGVELWCRYDRTAGVYGEQGSGKTLDVLAPALLAHRGAALTTLTRLDDLLLTAERRQQTLKPGGLLRPIAVLDPFGAAAGLPEFVWDPIAGCVDPHVAERRAKAFAAGTVTGAVTDGRQENAARFYAAETAKVLQGFLHAAALTGRTLDHVLEWVANPVAAEQPAEILRQHPHAARFWDGLLAGAMACLDELPSTTPLPTLRVRMANERPLGLSFIYAAQTWKQMVVSYGEDEARSLFGLTNNLIIFGGGKDIHFYKEISDLIDDVRISRRQTISDGPGGVGTSRAGEWDRVLRPGDIRRIPERHALVVAGNAPPIIARLRRCLDGKDGRALKASIDAGWTRLAKARKATPDIGARRAAAMSYARDHRLAPAATERHAESDDADHRGWPW